MAGKTRILVINRYIKPEEIRWGSRDLNEYVFTLRHRGFDVTELKNLNNLEAVYDIIVAHPSKEDIDALLAFSSEHQEIPLIIYSGHPDIGEEDPEFRGFSKDAYGVYYSYGSTMKELLKLIDHLKPNRDVIDGNSGNHSQ